MAKRVVRALGLIFGCVLTASLGYTTAINVIELSWQYTPRMVYYYQAPILARLLGQQINMDNINVCLCILLPKIYDFNFDSIISQTWCFCTLDDIFTIIDNS